MPYSASQQGTLADPVGRCPVQEAEVRRKYARKRSAEEGRRRALALTRLVETDIIPKLKLLHPRLAVLPDAPVAKPDAHQVEAFAQLLLGPDLSASSEAFTGYLTQRYTVESLFLDLLAPAASLLGRLWDDDLCDFIEVATGIARLQMLLSRFRSVANASWGEDLRYVLVMGAPGELHTFGVAVVEQFLQAAGWQVTSGMASSPDEIAELVSSRWFGVVGLTLSCESRLEGLATSIRSVREASVNRSIGVMVGGPVFLANPDLVGCVGADASAVDAPTAVLLAQRLLDIGMANGTSLDTR